METEIDLRAVFGFLRRQFRLILAVFAGTMLLAVAYVLTSTPVYTASALVMVDPTGRDLIAEQGQPYPAATSDARLESEVRLAQSDTVLLAVIENERLLGAEGFTSESGVVDHLRWFVGLRQDAQPSEDQQLWQTLKTLDGMVAVTRSGSSYLLNIAATSEDADTAQQIANAVARAYIQVQLGAKVQSTVDARNVVLQQIDTARLRMAEARARMDEGAVALAGTEVYEIQQQTEAARAEYDQLLLRAQQLQSQASLQLADSRIVSPALRPGSPSGPNARSIFSLAGIMGVALGLGTAFLHANFIGGVVSDEQLAQLARTKLALSVPRVRPQEGHNSVADLVIAAPLSAYAEAVRRIRSSMEHHFSGRADGPAPVIMVTSTDAAEGKTTLSLSLSRSFAQAGKRTLLIDCDLRQPSLHREVKATVTHDLVDALRAQNPAEKLKDAIFEDLQENLFVLLCSRNSESATDQLLVSSNFDRLLTAARRSFDLVILDTPPLGQVVDGHYLAGKADAVAMVVRWATTPRQSVRRSLLTLEGAIDKAHLVPVLSMQDQQITPYGGRYFRYRMS